MLRLRLCPASAVISDLTAANVANPWRADNAAFFAEPLPGRDGPIGTPGAAAKIGRITPIAATAPAATS